LKEICNRYQYVLGVLHASGRNLFGKRGRPIAMQLCEHGHNISKSLIKKSKFAQFACERGHRVGFEEARNLDLESNNTHR
jgi:hypothetical protein